MERTKNTQYHTPTPWMASEGQLYNYDNISKDSGKTLAYIPYYDEENERDRANAAFIVQAVNSHDALVEALTVIMSEIDEQQKCGGGYSIDTHLLETLDKARAALALAKGEL